MAGTLTMGRNRTRITLTWRNSLALVRRLVRLILAADRLLRPAEPEKELTTGSTLAQCVDDSGRAADIFSTTRQLYTLFHKLGVFNKTILLLSAELNMTGVGPFGWTFPSSDHVVRPHR